MGITGWLVNEIRSSLATPERWLTDYFGGSVTNAGVRINEDTALTMSAVWNAVTILSGTLMQLPPILYRRDAESGKTRATDRRLYSVLHDRANPTLSAARWRQTSMCHVALWGNSYSLIEWGRDGQIKNLWLLQPSRMRIESKGGQILYYYTPKDGKETEYRREEILHIAGLGYDGIQGYSPITLMRESLGLGLAAEEFGARFFGEGTHPSVIGMTPNKMSEEAKKRLREDLAKKYSGLGKSHRFLLLEDDVKIENISIPPEDAQFLETRKFQVVEVARWYNLPPHMLKDLDRATFSNIEHQSIEFLTINMGPWLTIYESEIARQILRSDEIGSQFIEFQRAAFLKGDVKSRNESYAIGKQNGWLTTNEIRKAENLNPVGEEGDELWMPANMIPAKDALNGQQTANADGTGRSQRSLLPEATRKASIARLRISRNYVRIIEDAAGRMVRREVNDVRGAIKKYIEAGKTDEFLRWLGGFYRDHEGFVRNAMTPVLTTYADEIYAAAAEEINDKFEHTPDMDVYTAGYIAITARRHVESSEGQIRKIVEDIPDATAEKTAELINERLTEWDEKRPKKIASRESVDGRSAFASLVFFAAGYDLVWRNNGTETCPYCKALNGKKVGRGGYFVGPGEDFEPEGADGSMKIRGPKQHPQLHDGCDCYITAE